MTGATPDALRLSWTVARGRFSSFVIQYKDAQGQPRAVPVKGEESAATIAGLESGRKYKMTLYGLHGRQRVGPVSVVATTGESGLQPPACPTPAPPPGGPCFSTCKNSPSPSPAHPSSCPCPPGPQPPFLPWVWAGPPLPGPAWAVSLSFHFCPHPDAQGTRAPPCLPAWGGTPPDPQQVPRAQPPQAAHFGGWEPHGWAWLLTPALPYDLSDPVQVTEPLLPQLSHLSGGDANGSCSHSGRVHPARRTVRATETASRGSCSVSLTP